MKRLATVSLALLLCAGTALSVGTLSAWMAQTSTEAQLAAAGAGESLGLTEAELEAYRLGFAQGYDAAKGADTAAETLMDTDAPAYVLNIKSRKFHRPSCPSAGSIKPANREDVRLTREEIIRKGYVPCKRCDP